MSPRIVYSPRYDIGLLGLERLHPFDAHKYSRAYGLLRRRFGGRLRRWRLDPDRQVSDGELRLVHQPSYLDQRLRSAPYLAGALEMPIVARLPARLIDWAVLRAMRWATRGTVLAAAAALEQRFAVNLAGGYHHASAQRGEGFCVYADVGVAVAMLRSAGTLAHDDTVLHIDLDAHQGNGVARVFAEDDAVRLFDLYNGDIYPQDAVARRRVDCDRPLPDGSGDERYLGTLEASLPGFLDRASRPRTPRLAFYNAGTDVFVEDQLGGLHLSAEAILRRDLYVIEALTARTIPWVMLLSGGYSRRSYQLVAESVGAIFERWG